MTDHTPTPWSFDTDCWELYSIPAYQSLAMLLGGSKVLANGDFIVKAVNNHEALVKVLEAALVIAKQEWDFPGAHPMRAAVVRDMEAALADVGSPGGPANEL